MGGRAQQFTAWINRIEPFESRDGLSFYVDPLETRVHLLDCGHLVAAIDGFACAHDIDVGAEYWRRKSSSAANNI
jgi:hypothetical protein